MARISEDALDDVERAKLASRRRAHADPRRPSLPVVRSSAGSALSLALLVVGAGLLVAPDALPIGPRLAAICAVALGGFLARPTGGQGDAVGERRILALERNEVMRVLTGLAFRGNDALAGIAERLSTAAPGGQPEPPGDDGAEARRAAIHALTGQPGGGGEGLDLEPGEAGLP